MKTRHTFIIVLAVVAALLVLTTGLTWAMNSSAVQSDPKAPPMTGFTYQGYLTDGGQLANDPYDFIFELFNEETEGESFGSFPVEDVKVVDGLFTVGLDFGEVFNGEPRWLEISVQPSQAKAGYTLLEGRQRITPAPYALYALEAGEVAWTDVTGRPGSCAVGSTIRLINTNGSVVCEPHDTRPVFKDTALVIDVNVDGYTSITIGADGLPIISYQDDTNNNLKVAHCNDTACTSASISTLDSTGWVGRYASITIGVDGLPIISYYDSTNHNLKVAHCNNTACTSASTSAPDTSDNVGGYTSITIGVDGLPVISYMDFSNSQLKLAHCNNTACTSASTNILDNVGDYGGYTSIAIGSDGLPVISYYDDATSDVNVAHCNNTACTTSITNTLDTSGIGLYTSITIGTDGLPIISYTDDNDGYLSVAHCDDTSCTTASINVVDTSEAMKRYTSITIGSDGLPVIAYLNLGNDYLNVAHCNDNACTSASTIIATNIGFDTGEYPSITIGTDGMPIISHYKMNGDLIVTHCSNPFCIPNWQRR